MTVMWIVTACSILWQPIAAANIPAVTVAGYTGGVHGCSRRASVVTIVPIRVRAWNGFSTGKPHTAGGSMNISNG